MRQKFNNLMYFLMGVLILTLYCSVGNGEGLNKSQRNKVRQNAKTAKPSNVKRHKTTTATVGKWERTLESLILVESGGNRKAVNDNTNAVGVLQIRPVYVAEVNRILGENRYTLQDRYSVRKSIEMYQVIQDRYNPQHSVERAIKLHNPTATQDYHDKVVDQIKQLRQDQSYQYQYIQYL